MRWREGADVGWHVTDSKEYAKASQGEKNEQAFACGHAHLRSTLLSHCLRWRGWNPQIQRDPSRDQTFQWSRRVTSLCEG